MSEEENTSGPAGPDSERLFGFLKRWAAELVPGAPPPQPSIPPLKRKRLSPGLLFLKTLPWLSLAGYLVSLRWDLSGPLPVDFFWRRSDPVMLDGLLRMLSVCGLVGYATNWVAVKMLFYPRKKRPLLRQGLIPARKDRIVLRLAESISREIINAELISQRIAESGIVGKYRRELTASLDRLVTRPEFRREILELTEYYLIGFLRSPGMQEKIRELVAGIDFTSLEGIEGGLFRLYRFVKGDREVTEQIRNMLETISFRMDEYEDKLESFLKSLPERLDERGEILEEYTLRALVFLIEQMDLQRVIVENLQRFDEVRLERLLMRSTSDQLQYIQYLGSLFGMIGGLFIWQPLESFVLFALLGGSLLGLDAILFARLRGKR